MTLQFKYSSLSSPEEIEQLGQITSQCFGGSAEEFKLYLDRLGADNFRVLKQQERAIAGLAIYHMGQWFGGNIVPMAGIAAVGTSPEARGRGAARELLSHTVRELHRLQIPISALYPATQKLYRQVGYEQAGIYSKWELPLANIQLQDRQLPMSRVSLGDRYLFEDIYDKQARVSNGNLARHQAIWQRILEPQKKETIYAYLLGSASKPEGYIIFKQNLQQPPAIEIKDWALLTASAAKRLWTFLADHRSQIELVIWRGAAFNPFLLLLPEQSARMPKHMMWMLRLIDLPLALSKRGYPPGLTAELHLEVRDDLIAANNGKFCLQVSQGQGEVSPGGTGDFKLDIRSLAALYTGFYSPQQLQLLDRLQTSSAALETASLVFSGDRPWMADFF